VPLFNCPELALLTVQRTQHDRSLAESDAIVHVVDDDEPTRDLIRELLKTVGLQVATYALPSLFMKQFDVDRAGCVVLDLRMPGLNGVEILTWLRTLGRITPVIVVTGYADLATAVRVMKLGAVEFFEKPFNTELLVEAVQRWVRGDIAAVSVWSQHNITLQRLATLSGRERNVLECVLHGMSNKETARHLGVSPKAVEIYRGHLMRKMDAANVVKLVMQITGYLKSPSRLVGQPFLNPIDIIAD
jgi:two-component system, LuxR family, response regulator FixJ